MFRVSRRSEIQADKTRIEKELWEAMTRQEIRYQKKHFFLRFYFEKCSDILKKKIERIAQGKSIHLTPEMLFVFITWAFWYLCEWYLLVLIALISLMTIFLDVEHFLCVLIFYLNVFGMKSAHFFFHF